MIDMFNLDGQLIYRADIFTTRTFYTFLDKGE
jgi:hypothetical protein